jgi:hypothetical protein
MALELFVAPVAEVKATSIRFARTVSSDVVRILNKLGALELAKSSGRNPLRPIFDIGGARELAHPATRLLGELFSLLALCVNVIDQGLLHYVSHRVYLLFSYYAYYSITVSIGCKPPIFIFFKLI